MTIGPLRRADIPVLDRILCAAYGSIGSVAKRLERYAVAQRVATFVASCDGAPVGCVFASDYGTVAYVSLMGVDPAGQRRGVGTTLFAALIAWADARGFASVQLDATPDGARLYERFAFFDDGETVVFDGVGRAADRALAPAVRPARHADLDAMWRADRDAFGADRAEVIGQLCADPTNAVFVADRGAFAVAQAEAIGPLVAATPDIAAALFDASSAARPGDALRFVAPSDNPKALALASSRGFVERRRLAHMAYGARSSGDRKQLFARINLGQG